ncbi:MAG: sporulation integral membrane protein YtvI [Clostridia bacterium]|nr:sporulation integral membrane protein YtvI [Clostridia bacterium]
MGTESRSKKQIIITRIAVFIGTIILLLLMLKFAVFFTPFLIAGIIAVLIEPVIKFCMNKLKMSRRVSSFIVVVFTIILIGYVVFWGVTNLASELLKLTSNIEPAITQVTTTIDTLSDTIVTKFPEIPMQVANAVENSIVDFVGKFGNLIASFASTVVKVLLSVPTLIVNVVITILALVFFTKDRIYVIDMLEHHFPKSWISSAGKVIKEIFSSIGGYIKVYAKIILITFFEVFIAFKFIFNWFGLTVKYPLAFAIIVAVVDILPILGVGTILIPWSLWLFITGEIGFGFLVILTYIAITVIRNFIEPKLVSKQFGIHPLITLMAMYAGFRTVGVVGLLLGPIMLMILRCIFDKQIERGLFKDMFDAK